MKKYILVFSILTSFALSAGAAKTPEWADPHVNRVGDLPSHTSFFAFESQGKATAGCKAASERFLTLEGQWKFHFSDNITLAPAGFQAIGYNDKAWGYMPVPGMIELNGYGTAIYKNVGYAWHNSHANTEATQTPPVPPTIDNYVGNYRREITVPASWKGSQVVLHIGSATSNIRVWVNGVEVGYSEDSKDAVEFDVTKYLRLGSKNLIAFQVMRWSDGSYFEDQDFWRFTGIAREVYLFSRPVKHVDDVLCDVTLVNDYKDGVLDVTVKASKGVQPIITLLDACGAEIARAQGLKAHFEVPAVHAWSAEIPYLYTLYVNTGAEVIRQKVGFRTSEIRGGQLLVNGQPILIKGVNRHELDPQSGYVVSIERMRQDLEVMKSLNVNAIRTCHYPDDPRFYDLCDEMGFYMVAETNIESHGMGYGEYTLADKPLYEQVHVERNLRNVAINRNHPAVIIWSLGNEAGYGCNFEKAYEAVRAAEPSRPIQYEQAKKDGATDIYCPMYRNHADSESYCQDTKYSKPLIQCEYAHAMGNSGGGFKEYWELIRKYPNYQGGFIWDFQDQGLSDVSARTGKRIWTYGGDYGRYPSSDHNFNCNGIIDPDRRPTPQCDEIAYFHQNYWVKSLDAAAGKISVYSENFFRTAEHLSARVALLANGREVASRYISDFSLAPQECRELSFAGFELCPCCELAVNVNILEDGAEVAHHQQVIGDWFALEHPAAVICAEEPVQLHEVVSNAVLSASGLAVTFNKTTGWIDYIDYYGKAVLADGSSLHPQFWRGLTDNDHGAHFERTFRKWYNPELKLQSMSIEGSHVTTVYEVVGLSSTLTMRYEVTPAGELLVEESLAVDPSVDPSKVQPLVFGMYFTLPGGYEPFRYYGRGPIENYCDRNAAARLGYYHANISDQFWAYVRPQETGNHTDCRFVELDGPGVTLRIDAVEAPFQAQALHYSLSQLYAGHKKKEIQIHSGDLNPRAETYLRIASDVMGLGGVTSWGAWPLEQYQTLHKNHNLKFKVTVK